MNQKQLDQDAIQDMILASEQALSFIASMKKEEFLLDKKTQAAVERQLEVIGEAANRVSTERRLTYPQIPWRDIINMRNKLIHCYDDIEME